MKRLFFSLGGLLLAFLFGYQILTLWRGFYLYAAHPTKEALLHALRLSPSNPDPYYRLGLLYLWDLQSHDLAKSLDYLCQAIRRNPLEQEYWLNLAKALQRKGERAWLVDRPGPRP